MKNKLLILTIGVICGLFLFTGCFSSTPAVVSSNVDFSNYGRFGEQILIPAKDFMSLGLIFETGSIEYDSNGAITQGDIAIYQKLLKQAQGLGADAIINIAIDRQIENRREGNSRRSVQRWYASALAIKYTEVLSSSDTTEVYLNRSTEIQMQGGESGSSEARRRGLFGL